jgi:hypothetical protein
LLALALATSAAAHASGIARVQHVDGKVEIYQVNIRIEKMNELKTMRISTTDGKGTLIIKQAACSAAGEIIRCYPYDIELDQEGSVKPINLSSGTLYVNKTDTAQMMPHSTAHIAPHSILLTLRTKLGTYINVDGQIDRGSK